MGRSSALGRLVLLTALCAALRSESSARCLKFVSGFPCGPGDCGQLLHYDGNRMRLDIVEGKDTSTIIGDGDSLIVLRHRKKEYLKLSPGKLQGIYVKLNLLKQSLETQAGSPRADSLRQNLDRRVYIRSFKSTGKKGQGPGLECGVFEEPASGRFFCVSENGGKVKLSKYNLTRLLEYSQSLAFISEHPFFISTYELGDGIKRFGLLTYLEEKGQKKWGLRTLQEVDADRNLFAVPVGYARIEDKQVLSEK